MKYVFNGFSLDVKSRLLIKGDKKFQLEPKIFELLWYFCQRPKQAISREQLITDVWQNRIVSYAAINRAVSELRKVIEEQVTKPKLIITVSKVGYLFDGQVVVEHEDIDIEDEQLSTEIESIIDPISVTSKFLVEEEINNFDLSGSSKVKPQKKSNFNILLIGVTLVVAILFYVKFSESTDTKPTTLSVEKPLTTSKGTSFKGDLSDNGQDLVFLHKEKANGTVQIWLKKRGEIAERLSLDEYYYTNVIFAGEDFVLASRFNNLDERQCEIVKVWLQTKAVEKIFDCAVRAMTNLSYSLNSNTVYFNYRRSLTDAFNIYSYHLDTNSFQQLTFTDITAEHGDFVFALSPSETQIAVLEYRDKHQALLKFVTLNSKDEEVRFGPTFSANSRISWLSEDDLLLADGERLLSYNLLSQESLVLGTNTSIGYAKGHAESKQIIFDKGKIIANIYQYKLSIDNENSKHAVTNSSFINYQMQFANSSNDIAYLSTDSGENEIMIKPEGEHAFSSNFPEEISVIANIDWSDNDELLLAGINQQVYLYDTEQKIWRLLLKGEESIHYVHFIDGDNIAFSSKQSGQWQIWRMNLSSNKLTQLTTKGGYSVQFSSNKNTAYITKYNSPGIFKLDILTGSEQVLLPQHKVTSWKKWQLRGHKLYYINKKTLRQFDLATKADTLVATFELKAPASFSVSFDHSVIQRELVESSSSNIWVSKVE